jgi:hypothetical protein
MLRSVHTYTDLIFLKYKFTNIKDWKFNQYPWYKWYSFLRPSMAAFFCLLWWATNRRRKRKLHDWHKITHFDIRSLITTGAPSSIRMQNTNCPVLYCTVPVSTPDIYRTYSENCCCALVLRCNTAKRTNPGIKHGFHPSFTHYYLITHS